MKTTLEMPDTLFRRLKAHAAERGTSIKNIVNAAVARALSDPAKPSDRAGWRAAIGTIPPSRLKKINQAIEDAFERIDPADWK